MFSLRFYYYLLSHKSTHLRAQGLPVPTDTQCNQCGKMFASTNYLNEHIALLHENRSLRVKCKLCEDSFPDKNARDRYEDKVHFPEK